MLAVFIFCLLYAASIFMVAVAVAVVAVVAVFRADKRDLPAIVRAAMRGWSRHDDSIDPPR
jgi:hypothetical protein